MITSISIPGTIEVKHVLRIFTCYKDRIIRSLVDVDNFYTDLEWSESNDDYTHLTILEMLRAWRKQDVTKTILAYQIVQVSYIQDDRGEWNHKNQMSEADVAELSKKVFVYTNEQCSPEITGYIFLRGLGWLRTDMTDAPRPDIYSAELIHKLHKVYGGTRDDQKLLKLGACTFIPITPDITYLPEPSVNMN